MGEPVPDQRAAVAAARLTFLQRVEENSVNTVSPLTTTEGNLNQRFGEMEAKLETMNQRFLEMEAKQESDINLDFRLHQLELKIDELKTILQDLADSRAAVAHDSGPVGEDYTMQHEGDTAQADGDTAAPNGHAAHDIFDLDFEDANPTNHDSLGLMKIKTEPEEDESKSCGVCHEQCRKIIKVLVPCGHFPFCARCVENLKEQRDNMRLFARPDGWDDAILFCPFCTLPVKQATTMKPLHPYLDNAALI